MEDRMGACELSASGSMPLQLGHAPPLLDMPRLAALRLAVSPNAAPQRPFSVLLVDDDLHHRTPILRALRHQKHTVLCAADDISGEELFQTSQLEIDALVACTDMNRIGGFDLARRLRRVRPNIRVLLMCQHLTGPDGAHGTREGGFAVIEEPFTPEDLCRRLTDLLASPSDHARPGPSATLEAALALARAKPSAWLPEKMTDCPTKEIHPWNKAKLATPPIAGRRCGKRHRRS